METNFYTRNTVLIQKIEKNFIFSRKMVDIKYNPLLTGKLGKKYFLWKDTVKIKETI